MSGGWESYDSVAATYEQVAVPGFRPMARDLLEALRLRPGSRVLDLGTGTGMTAETARASVGREGGIVGIDPSLEMARIARAKREVTSVVGMAPGLPFAGESFDAVTANLVLSHVPDLALGVADVVRVLRSGGRVGATAWGPEREDPDDRSAAADAVLGVLREEGGIDLRPEGDPVPWEERLRSRSELAGVLSEAGLTGIEISRRPYRRVFTVEQYLAGWGTQGRFLRWRFGEETWRSFTLRAADELRARFGDEIVSIKDVWIAIGTAP